MSQSCLAKTLMYPRSTEHRLQCFTTARLYLKHLPHEQQQKCLKS